MNELYQTLQQFALGLIDKPLFGLLLSLGIYQLSLMLYQSCGRRSFLHPLVTSALAIAALLHQLDLPYISYQRANELLYFLLGPATVALAVPLYQQFHHIRQLALPVLLTVLIGGSFASASAVGIAWWLGADTLTLLSLTPKSVTTPIALGIANSIGALPGLAAGVVVFTGVIGALISPLIFHILRLQDPRLQGVVLGINAHGVGIARGFELNPSTGAFASLAMGLTGAFTALTLPYIVALF